jgi:microcystin-dependent protein
MSQPFIGEIRMFGGNFAPRGFAFCNGQILAISQNDALFALIGTTYGGDGQTTFALPNMTGRLPIHVGQLSGGSNYVLGQLAGTETVTVTTNQLPSHSHGFPANSNAASAVSPSSGVAASTNLGPYAQNAAVNTAMGAQMIGATSGNQPHDNVMPFLCISFIIALEGIFPSRN